MLLVNLLFSLTALSPALVGAFELDHENWHHRSIGHLSEEHLQTLAKKWDGSFPGASPAPGPLSDTSGKLVNDAAHPFMAPGPNDIRGPCPGLNTLANHGYLPRNGIATPQQIVNAVQEGFNFANDLAIFVGFGAMLAIGNPLTNLMSLGHVTPDTGTFKENGLSSNPLYQSLNTGLNFHGIFEGDASTTRSDAYLGNNHDFNETLFQVLVTASKAKGGGVYNAAAAAETRYQRWLHSYNNNPTFDFLTPRIFTAYGESVFPYRFFVDGTKFQLAPSLDLNTARSFFEKAQFPPNFHRRNGDYGLGGIGLDVAGLVLARPLRAGMNNGIGNYTTPPGEKGLTGLFCAIYEKAVTVTLPLIAPDPGSLSDAARNAVKANLRSWYSGIKNAVGSDCPEQYPLGK